MSLTLKNFVSPYRGSILALAAVCFVAGVIAGALIAPVGAGNRIEPPERPRVEPTVLRSGHPAEVIRVLDGDTFEARVRIWPGMDITTRVRLRGIDAPEMHARCDDERVKAIAARDALVRVLTRARSEFRALARTNMAVASMPMSRLHGPAMYRRRYWQAALRAVMTAANVGVGAAELFFPRRWRVRCAKGSPRVGILRGVRNPLHRGFVVAFDISIAFLF